MEPHRRRGMNDRFTIDGKHAANVRFNVRYDRTPKGGAVKYINGNDKVGEAKVYDTNGWHPIETAPKDGRDILVYDAGWKRIVISNFNGYGEWSNASNPTHYQSLPEPPTKEGE